MPDIHHWLHIYAGGDWQVPVAEHLDALERSGLGAELASFSVGIVGPEHARREAYKAIWDAGWDARLISLADEGWEQVTLWPMWRAVQHHRNYADGLICYTHTKGAGNFDPINNAWRRDMEYHNVMEWRRIVEAFDGGAQVAGAHWICDPNSGHAGMFGGNFWWVRADLLRQGGPPKTDYRHRAEEWLGDLGWITPLTVEAGTVFDLDPSDIAGGQLHTDW